MIYPLPFFFGVFPHFLKAKLIHLEQILLWGTMDPTPGETHLDSLVLTGTDGDIVGIDVDIGQWLLGLIPAPLLLHGEGLECGVSPTVPGQGVPAATTG